MIPSKHFENIFPLSGIGSEGLGAFRLFFKQLINREGATKILHTALFMELRTRCPRRATASCNRPIHVKPQIALTHGQVARFSHGPLQDYLMAAVNTACILSKSCVFFWVSGDAQKV